MRRYVEPELLDKLSPEDGRAFDSRCDLERLNWLMGNTRTMARLLLTQFHGKPPRCITDIGAGDGKFMLSVARQIGRRWTGVRLNLVDRFHLATASTLASFDNLGWEVTLTATDLLKGLNNKDGGHYQSDAVVANLFLHHFSDESLIELLRDIRRWTDVFIAVEPTRSGRALTFSRIVGLIGCRQVTRHDAPVSVRAGFRKNELSLLWGSNGEWGLEEYSLGWFRHVFFAKRVHSLEKLVSPCR